MARGRPAGDLRISVTIPSKLHDLLTELANEKDIPIAEAARMSMEFPFLARICEINLQAARKEGNAEKLAEVIEHVRDVRGRYAQFLATLQDRVSDLAAGMEKLNKVERRAAAAAQAVIEKEYMTADK